MTAYTLAPLLAALLNMGLVIWVYQESPRGPVRRTFILWNLSLTLWNTGVLIGYWVSDADQATRLYIFLSSFVVRFIAPLFLHFVVAFTRSEKSPLDRWALRLAYGAAVVFAILGLTTEALLRKAIHFHWGFYPQAGRWEWTFGLVYGLTVGFAFWRLIRAHQEASGSRRDQLRCLLWGSGVCFLSGMTNFLPMHGIAVYPIGNLLNSLYSVMVAYAVVAYGLMDMRLMLREGTLYAVWAAALGGFYVSVVGVFKMALGQYGASEQAIYYTAALPMTVMLAPLMRSRLKPWIEQAPFWRSYRYSEVLEDFSQTLLSTFELQKTGQLVASRFASFVNAGSTTVYLANDETGTLTAVATDGGGATDTLSLNHAIVRWMGASGDVLIKERALWEGRLPPEDLARWPFAISVPLVARDALVGMVACGPKETGGGYNTDDVALLQTLAAPAAIALQNSKGFAELERRQAAAHRTQDMALLGLLATEMAHELARPFTRILNEHARLEENVSENSKESLKKIEQETQRADQILNGFSMLSPERRLLRATVDLREIIDASLNALSLDETAGFPTFCVHQEYADDATVPVNSAQLQQVVMNVIQNAKEAMPGGGDLRIKIRRDFPESKTIEMIFEDTGPGIAPDHLSRVFEPFFTTKKSRGGRGVGLTLSRAMVERHGGSIVIESPVTERGGTRVVVSLPLHPKEESHGS